MNNMQHFEGAFYGSQFQFQFNLKLQIQTSIIATTIATDYNEALQQ